MRIEGYRFGERLEGDAVKRLQGESGKTSPFVVLKLGSSILRTLDDLSRVVTEIYRYQRNGTKVVAVVSGSNGEERATALLAAACDEAGLDARVIEASNLGLKAADHAHRSDFISVDQAFPHGELSQNDVVIVPGYVEIAEANYTVIGDDSSVPTASRPAPPLRVALAGCGIVGSGVADLLKGQLENFDLCGVLVRDTSKKRPASIGNAPLVSSLDELFEQAPDIIVDVLSSGELGLSLTEEALLRGVSIASANKQALADDLDRLHAIASKNNTSLAYSASVGGGTTMIETVRRVRKEGAVITQMDAIVNGTVNFILSELAAGNSFDDAVRAAQEAGFAEADPTADLSGADAVAKAKILAWEAFGRPIEAPVVHQALDQPILEKIRAAGGVWRQLTRISLDSGGMPHAVVDFQKIEDGDFFWDIPGEGNAIRVAIVDGPPVLVRGKGAGAVPTAHSILGDLGAIRGARRRLQTG